MLRVLKQRQHSLLTAAAQVTSKPQRIVFLQREPLVPCWAPVKGVAKSQLCSPTARSQAALYCWQHSASLGRALRAEAKRSHHPGLHRLLCSWGETRAASHGWGGGQKTQPGQLDPRLFQPPTLLLQDTLVWVLPHLCLSARDGPRGVGERLAQVLPTALTLWSHRRGTGLLGAQDPRCLLPCSPPAESVWRDERAHPYPALFRRQESCLRCKNALRRGMAVLSPWSV